MRGVTWTILLASALATSLGCSTSPTQPSGKAQTELQEAGQKLAEDDEKANQAEGKKMGAKKK